MEGAKDGSQTPNCRVRVVQKIDDVVGLHTAILLQKIVQTNFTQRNDDRLLRSSVLKE